MLMAEAVGRSVGLFIVAWGTPAGESNTFMITMVGLFCLPAGLVVLFLPESSRRELEDIGIESSEPGGG
jgi:hypothetical protein